MEPTVLIVIHTDIGNLDMKINKTIKRIEYRFCSPKNLRSHRSIKSGGRSVENVNSI